MKRNKQGGLDSDAVTYGSKMVRDWRGRLSGPRALERPFNAPHLPAGVFDNEVRHAREYQQWSDVVLSFSLYIYEKQTVYSVTCYCKKGRFLWLDWRRNIFSRAMKWLPRPFKRPALRKTKKDWRESFNSGRRIKEVYNLKKRRQIVVQ